MNDGGSQLALSLHPKDLGEVRIVLDRDADGATRVVVAATEPGTLRSLMTDQAHLHAALDAAAVPTANRHLTFELAPSATSSTSSDRQADAAPSWSGNGTAMDMSGQNGSRNSRSSGTGTNDESDQVGAAGSGGHLQQASTTTLRLRQGSINITA